MNESCGLPPPTADVCEVMDKLLISDVFGSLERERSIAACRRNYEMVRAKIPAERLLVFTPVDVWEPPWRFLHHPVPASEFPCSNAREEL